MGKTVFDYKIYLESVTMIELALLSYIFIALFRDILLGYICRLWFDGQMAVNGQF